MAILRTETSNRHFHWKLSQKSDSTDNTNTVESYENRGIPDMIFAVVHQATEVVPPCEQVLDLPALPIPLKLPTIPRGFSSRCGNRHCRRTDWLRSVHAPQIAQRHPERTPLNNATSVIADATLFARVVGAAFMQKAQNVAQGAVYAVRRDRDRKRRHRSRCARQNAVRRRFRAPDRRDCAGVGIRGRLYAPVGEASASGGVIAAPPKRG
jgi:hypothetical protein